MALADFFDPRMDHLRIRAAQVSAALIALAILPDQRRKSLIEKRQKNLIRARLQEQNVRPQLASPGGGSFARQSIQASLAVVEERHDRRASHDDPQPPICELADGG